MHSQINNFIKNNLNFNKLDKPIKTIIHCDKFNCDINICITITDNKTLYYENSSYFHSSNLIEDFQHYNLLLEDIFHTIKTLDFNKSSNLAYKFHNRYLIFNFTTTHLSPQPLQPLQPLQPPTHLTEIIKSESNVESDVESDIESDIESDVESEFDSDVEYNKIDDFFTDLNNDDLKELLFASKRKCYELKKEIVRLKQIINS